MSKVEEKIKMYKKASSLNTVAAMFGLHIDSEKAKTIKKQHEQFVHDLKEIQAEQEGLQKKADKYDEMSKHLEFTAKSFEEQQAILKEQNKPVEVDKFISDWYKLHENDLEFGIWKYIYDYGEQDKETKFYKWFNNTDNKPIETLIRMKDGYTVKQEQKYMVVFIESEDDRQILFKKGQEYEVDFESNNEGYWEQYFTEKEIKALNKNVWPLAEEVKEEQK